MTHRHLFRSIGLIVGFAAASLACAAAEDVVPPPRETSELQLLWQDVTHNLRDVDATAIATDPASPQRVFVGTAHALYRTVNGGRAWDEQLRLHGAATTVRSMLVLPGRSDHVVIATDQGAWWSHDGGAHWARSNVRRQSLSLLADPAQPDHCWLGAVDGLYASRDGGRSWRPVGAGQQQPVYALTTHPSTARTLWAMTDHSVLVSENAGQTWRSSLLRAATSGEVEVSDDADEIDTAPIHTAMLALAVHPERPQELVVATNAALLISHNAGASWDALPTRGLERQQWSSLVMTHASAPRLFVAGDHGVWTLDESTGQWQELYRGLTAHRVRQLAVQPLDGSLWAATDRGVFHGVVTSADAKAPLKAWALFQHEPSVDDVHRHAIRYSETNPEKIARWRHAAATQALLPTVSFGITRNKNMNDHFDEGTFPRFQLIPTRDYDRNIGVSVSWDLGELIWNNDQTSIDSRSKLTTELREQILSEATRLYFERRRLQLEMALAVDPEPQQTMEQTVRVQELTAQIDALTGGWFSRALEGHE